MNKKSNKFNVLYTGFLALILGFSLLSWNGKFTDKERPQSRLLVSQIETYLEQEDFFLTGKMRREFVTHLLATAKDYEFDPWLILAIIKVESSFKPDALSNRGAMGLLQLKPIAAREVANVYKVEAVASHRLYNPFVNVTVGVQYLSFLRDTLNTDGHRMLTAYNMGPTRVKQIGAVSSGYSNKVLKIYRALSKNGA